MIVDRYVIRQVARPYLVVCLVLVLIFSGYSTAAYLGKAAAGGLTRDAVLPLIGLKVAIAMEVLLPVALYLTVVVGLGRMYADREMTALQACGVSGARVLWGLCWVFVPVALVVGGLSLYGRPWAYAQSYLLRAQAEDRFDVASLEAGNFYNIPGGSRVLFADRVDPETKTLEGVFVALGEGADMRVFSASSGRMLSGSAREPSTLVLEGVQLYDLQGERILTVSSESLGLSFDQDRVQAPRYRRKSQRSWDLLNSTDSKDVAEVQWRLSRPLSTLLLGLLAVLLSRTDPRRGRYAKVFLAMLIYAGYYTLSLLARNWVGRGAVGSFPGLWWVEVLLASVFVWLFLRAGLHRRPPRRSRT